jgi:hypothetical protein
MNMLPYTDVPTRIRARGRRRMLLWLHTVAYTFAMVIFFFWLRTYFAPDYSVLIPPALWGILLVGHWLYNGWANDSEPVVERLWEGMYGTRTTASQTTRGAVNPSDHEPTYDSIREAVEAELTREKMKRRRLLFRINLAAYLVVMVVAWIIVPAVLGPFYTASSGIAIFLLSFGGLAEVLLHYLAYRLDTAEGERGMRERLLGRALQQQMQDTEKSKRHTHLTDDGELLDETDDFGDDESLARARRG